MMTPEHSILAMTRPQFTDAARAEGLSERHALALYRACFRSGAEAPLWAPRPALELVKLDEERPSEEENRPGRPLLVDDAVRKFLLRAPEGTETESVLLPQISRSGRRRTTLCVSSQIGCAMGCTFCETAQMGRVRQLSAAEIVAQWDIATHRLRRRPDNIVFMGMGEPMDNLGAVLDAIAVLLDHDGPAVAASRITVSTVGRPEGIRRLADACAERAWGRVHLALSLNAPNDEIRSAIMPVNRAAPMRDLYAAVRDWNERRRARVLIEYVLIPGVNDGDDHAAELARFLHGLDVTLNVIPYNPRRDSPWPAPAEEDVERFIGSAADRGMLVRRRITLGRRTMAACGQLGNEEIRNRVALRIRSPEEHPA